MRSQVSLLVVGVILLAASAWAAEKPVAVSPGSPTGTAVESRCPTFSWDPVDGARAHELVVYQVGEEGQEAEPVLKQEFPGSASSWTPPLKSCLNRGDHYAWSVRAHVRKGASEWSPPSLFEVASGPSEAEFEEALQVVQQYLATRSGVQEEGVAATETAAEPEPSPETATSPPSPAAVGTTQLRVDGGVEATSFTGSQVTVDTSDQHALRAINNALTSPAAYFQQKGGGLLIEGWNSTNLVFYVFASGAIRAPLLQDSGDSSYLVDPDGSSKLSALEVDSQTWSCGSSYTALDVCPILGDGPNCDEVPVGGLCESEGECGTSDNLNNCSGGWDWYVKTAE